MNHTLHIYLRASIASHIELEIDFVGPSLQKFKKDWEEYVHGGPIKGGEYEYFVDSTLNKSSLFLVFDSIIAIR